MRKSLVDALLKEMAVNKDIFFVTADLGFRLFDRIRDTYPDRFVNTGASEVSAVTTAVGLAWEGKVPFVYSITPFLLYRAFESIRYYLDHEQAQVKLLGGGRDNDYHIDGFSHNATDVYMLFDRNGYSDEEIIEGNFSNIKDYWPKEVEEIPSLLKEVINNKKPCFISLRK